MIFFDYLSNNIVATEMVVTALFIVCMFYIFPRER